MVDTKSKILIENTADRSKSGWLSLPFSEDDLSKLLASIGVVIDDDEEDGESDYDRLMAGELPNVKWKVVDYESDYLMDKHFDDIYAASDLVERIENLRDCEVITLDALIADGDELEQAIETVEDGDVNFYADTDLSSLARQFADEGIFHKDFLLGFIDYDALGRALEDDGYTEVNGGVLMRP